MTISDFFNSHGFDVTITVIKGIDDVILQLDEPDHNILLLGDLEHQPEVDTWKSLIAKLDKAFLHGSTAFQLFMPPYIDVEGAQGKTTYCPELNYIAATLDQYIRGESLESSKVHIFIHDKLKVVL